MIDPTLDPYVLPPGTPETCGSCGGPLGYDDAQRILCCATHACYEYRRRILWPRPTQWFDGRGNVLP